MSKVRESVDVSVPVHVAYERLCHFEEYPQFMPDVREVSRVSDTMAHWVMDLAGTHTEFDARVTARRPDELLAWQAIDGPGLSEKMVFQSLSADRCRIIAELGVDARAFIPGEALARESLDRMLKAELAGFKRYIEADTSHLLAAALDETDTAALGRTDTAAPARLDTAARGRTDMAALDTGRGDAA